MKYERHLIRICIEWDRIVIVFILVGSFSVSTSKWYSTYKLRRVADGLFYVVRACESSDVHPVLPLPINLWGLSCLRNAILRSTTSVRVSAFTWFPCSLGIVPKVCFAWRQVHLLSNLKHILQQCKKPGRNLYYSRTLCAALFVCQDSKDRSHHAAAKIGEQSPKVCLSVFSMSVISFWVLMSEAYWNGKLQKGYI